MSRQALIDSERSKEMLSMDKTYLQSELRQSEMRSEDRARQLDASVSKALGLEVKVSQLTDQLLTLQLSVRNGFDDRMDKEVHRLREEALREMDSLKAAARDISDRENRVLREAKTSLESENELLRRKVDHLTEEVQQVSRQMTTSLHEKGCELQDLRSDLKMKIFELGSLGATFEQRMSHLRRVELDLDLSRQEVAAHRAAVLRVESEGAQQLQEVRRALEQAEKRLQSYDDLVDRPYNLTNPMDDRMNCNLMIGGGGRPGHSERWRCCSSLQRRSQGEAGSAVSTEAIADRGAATAIQRGSYKTTGGPRWSIGGGSSSQGKHLSDQPTHLLFGAEAKTGGDRSDGSGEAAGEVGGGDTAVSPTAAGGGH